MMWYCQGTGTATRRVSRTCATTSPPAPGEPANGNTASGHVTQSSPLIGCRMTTLVECWNKLDGNVGELSSWVQKQVNYCFDLGIGNAGCVYSLNEKLIWIGYFLIMVYLHI